MARSDCGFILLQSRTTSTSTCGFLPVHSVAQRRTARRTSSRSLPSLPAPRRAAPAPAGAGSPGERLAILLDRDPLETELDAPLEAVVLVQRQRDRDDALPGQS